MTNRDEDIRKLKIMRTVHYNAYQEAKFYHIRGRLSQTNLEKFEKILRDAEFELSNVMYKCENCLKSDVDLMYDKHSRRWLCFPCNGVCQAKRDNAVIIYQNQVDFERREHNYPPEYLKCSKCGCWSDDFQLYGENDIICSDCMYNAVTL